MEDFYDVKSSIIDGKHISLFGIFDGPDLFPFQSFHCFLGWSSVRLLIDNSVK